MRGICKELSATKMMNMNNEWMNVCGCSCCLRLLLISVHWQVNFHVVDHPFIYYFYWSFMEVISCNTFYNLLEKWVNYSFPYNLNYFDFKAFCLVQNTRSRSIKRFKWDTSLYRQKPKISSLFTVVLLYKPWSLQFISQSDCELKTIESDMI